MSGDTASPVPTPRAGLKTGSAREHFPVAGAFISPRHCGFSVDGLYLDSLFVAPMGSYCTADQT